MPWKVEKVGEPSRPFCVVDRNGAKVHCFATMRAANRMMQAMYANADPEDFPSMMDSEEDGYREDVVGLAKMERTPQGGLILDGRITRVGVFSYPQPDGSVIRELRHPDDVFDPESLASLENAPVTDGHPPPRPEDGEPLVGPEEWSRYSVGLTRDVRRDGKKFIAGRLVVQDGKALSAIRMGARVELSAGYTRKIKRESGTYDGQPYDVRQTNIRYNHVAILPRGMARGGRDLQMRLDGREHEEPNMIRIDGLELPTEGTAAQQAFDRFEKTLRAEIQAAKDEAKAATARADSLAGELAGVRKTLEETQGKLAAAESPTALDARVTARTALVASAAKVLGAEVKLDGKTDKEIRALVVAKRHPEVKLDGMSEDFLAGLFMAAVAAPAAGPTALDAVHAAAVDSQSAPAMPADKEAALAHRRMVAYNQNLWRGEAEAQKLADAVR